MGAVGGRPIKKLFLILLGLSVILIIIKIVQYSNQSNMLMSIYSFDINNNKINSSTIVQDVNLKMFKEEPTLNTQENLIKNQYKNSNTSTAKYTSTLIYETAMEILVTQTERKDWNDYEAIKVALSRTGLGELGVPSVIEKTELRRVAAAVNESFHNYGFNGYLSDRISVNRSIPDLRAYVCQSTKYLANLPKVSIIMPFRDECFSTLVRSIHSIINRTPTELLEEIILVDDYSSLDHLKAKLTKYIEEFFPKVKLVRLSERNGIMQARLVGAKLAKSEILVIFDAHIEVGYNWLPPLIEPIVLNKKTCTLPYIDRIQAETMSYIPTAGFRGGFDWEFYYHRLPLLSANDETIPHPNPVMLGGIFAIAANFFWELGGYDNELQIWGGEQYELSFKIWMCGGTLLDIPCSRVAHVSQISSPIRYKGMNNSAVFRNYKRISEVWMDDYKKYINQNIPEQFKNVDVGNVTIQKTIRENLQCKSFDWYLNEIAFDSLKHYPYEDPASVAGGAIRNIGYPQLCIAMKINLQLTLRNCTSIGNINGKKEQTWLFTQKGEIRKKGEMECLEAKYRKRKIFVSNCHGLQGKQKWIYNKKSKMIIHASTNRCLAAAPLAGFLVLFECTEKIDQLQWEFSWYNDTMNVSE